MTKIIGLAGKAWAGKDTSALILGAELIRRGVACRIEAFAQPMKAALKAMGLPEPQDREKREQIMPDLGFSWRKAAQTLGTEWGRGLNPDLWLLLMKRKFYDFAYNNPQGVFIISDVRFENEADFVREHGMLLHVVRGSDVGAGMTAEASTHASETADLRKSEDSVVLNCGSLEELHYGLMPIVVQVLNARSV